MWVCHQCCVAICNDDYSGLSPEREKRVSNGVKRGWWTVQLDFGQTESSETCSCCGAIDRGFPDVRYPAELE